MLPNISNVQEHAEDIMILFKQQGNEILKKNAEEEAMKAAKKKKTVTLYGNRTK